MGDYELPDELINKLNPIELISQYWTDNFINLLCSQSKMYAKQHALQSEKVTPNNPIAGYIGLNPRIHEIVLWHAMQRDTFDQILRCFHFADNM